MIRVLGFNVGYKVFGNLGLWFKIEYKNVNGIMVVKRDFSDIFGY